MSKKETVQEMKVRAFNQMSRSKKGTGVATLPSKTESRAKKDAKNKED